MPHPHFPVIIYGSDPTTLSLTLTPMPWTVAQRVLGGGEIAISGAAESFTVATRYPTTFPFRVRESELAATLTWIAYQRANLGATFTLNLGGAGARTCRLLSPLPGDQDWEPERGGSSGRLWICTVVLYKVDGTPFSEPYYAAAS